MPITPDGSVVPSFLSLFATEPTQDEAFGDNVLRQGEIKEIIYPDDDKSFTKQYIEYTIWCQYKLNGVGSGRKYFGAIIMNDFASLADKTCQILRVNPKAGQPKANDKDQNAPSGLGLGSKVLFLCINGETAFPIIIRGLPDPKDQSQKAVDLKDGEVQYTTEFNGITTEINKDGEYTLTYGGKTDIEGKTDADDDVRGTFINFDKDGGLTFSDQKSDNSLYINHKDGQVEVQRKNKFILGDGADKMLRGTSFRDAETSMHSTMQGIYKSMAQLVQNVGTQWTSTAPRLAVPVVGGTLASPSVLAIGVLWVSISQLVGQLGQAIQQYEQKSGQKSNFLSDKDFVGDDF